VSDAPPLLAARQSVAAALALWIDTDVWKPPVMPRLFSRGPAASGDTATLASQVARPRDAPARKTFASSGSCAEDIVTQRLFLGAPEAIDAVAMV
jgi:hypothetical protein